MTIIGSRLFLCLAAVALSAGSALAEANSPAANPQPAPGQSLSDKLSRSNGVIHPKEVDPAIEKPAPDPQDQNVIPPGAAPGSPAPQPK